MDMSKSRTNNSIRRPAAMVSRSRSGIGSTTKSDGARAIAARRHQQEFAMLVIPIGLRKIPDGALWAVMAAPAQDGGAGVGIGIFIGPLPDIAHHIENTKRAGAGRMRLDR